ncbi:MAG: murein L,D-transpeptidase [Verrucomicrobia bacterium]|nr:murein L,D-transpeptidase [Verrucomicrobiota bacterium]
MHSRLCGPVVLWSCGPAIRRPSLFRSQINCATLPAVRLDTRYRAKRPRKEPGWKSGFFALLCLGLAGVIGWVWWNSTQFTEPPPPARRVPPTTPPVPPSPSVPAPQPRVVTPSPATSPPPEATNVARRLPLPPPELDLTGDARPVQNIFEAQLAMAREGISSGPIDGGLGSQTRAALGALQRKRGLVPTGVLDGDTKALLQIKPPLCVTYVVTTDDLARLLPVPKTWLGKSEQPRLDYETLLELVAEKSFAHPSLIRSLNPEINWSNVLAGAVVKVPRVEHPPPRARAALVRISLSGKTLEAFDAATNLLAHFPCSIGKLAEKRPVGELSVAVVAPDPNYTFNPAVFPESEEGRRLGRKLVLPPGPNNPVGTAWIGLDRPGYGIHGTPAPEQVGRTESHGCFRLANWNAEYLARLVTVGTPVVVEP